MSTSPISSNLETSPSSFASKHIFLVALGLTIMLFSPMVLVTLDIYTGPKRVALTIVEVALIFVIASVAWFLSPRGQRR